jgi:hypothetical protein
LLGGIRSRLTYANVVSTLCLFILLGGVAWAAAMINSKDVIDNSLKSADLKNGKGVKGADVVPDSLGGAAVDESSLALGSEAWQPLQLNDGADDVGSPGDFCFWTAVGSDKTAPAYFRDSAGVVHLKGLVRANDGSLVNCGPVAADPFIALPGSLPLGYRPGNEQWVLATVSNNKPGRISVDPSGFVHMEPGFPTFADAEVWVSLDGLSFRCAPSGQDGCP